jgi:ribosomal protein L37AE/L43A
VSIQPKYSTNYESHLILHVKTVHEKIMDLKCQECDFVGVLKCNLTMHVKSVHEQKIRNHKCQYCNFTTTNKMDLKMHVKIVHDFIAISQKQCTYDVLASHNF